VTVDKPSRRCIIVDFCGWRRDWSVFRSCFLAQSGFDRSRSLLSARLAGSLTGPIMDALERDGAARPRPISPPDFIFRFGDINLLRRNHDNQ